MRNINAIYEEADKSNTLRQVGRALLRGLQEELEAVRLRQERHPDAPPHPLSDGGDPVKFQEGLQARFIAGLNASSGRPSVGEMQLIALRLEMEAFFNDGTVADSSDKSLHRRRADFQNRFLAALEGSLACKRGPRVPIHPRP